MPQDRCQLLQLTPNDASRSHDHVHLVHARDRATGIDDIDLSTVACRLDRIAWHDRHSRPATHKIDDLLELAEVSATSDRRRLLAEVRLEPAAEHVIAFMIRHERNLFERRKLIET